jgi:hypothetical protein
MQPSEYNGSILPVAHFDWLTLAGVVNYIRSGNLLGGVLPFDFLWTPPRYYSFIPDSFSVMLKNHS